MDKALSSQVVSLIFTSDKIKSAEEWNTLFTGVILALQVILL